MMAEKTGAQARTGSLAKPEVNAPAHGAEPTMEDILASIRRILSEDSRPEPQLEDDHVLVLDQSMLVPEETQVDQSASQSPSDTPAEPPRASVPPPAEVSRPDPAEANRPGGELVAPEAAAAAASALGDLVRALATERSVAVHRGGPTLEDIVREALRPMLKEWLDAHLPTMVERLVRAEIERVVGRAEP